MKKFASLLIGGALWFLGTGMAVFKPPIVLPPPQIVSAPLPSPVLESRPQKREEPSLLLSQFEERWRTERLLAISA